MNNSLHYQVTREYLLKNHQLGDSLLSVQVGDSYVTIHREEELGELWCVEVSHNGGSLSRGGPDFGAMKIGDEMVIYGQLPPDTVQVEASFGNVELLVKTASAVFLTVTPCTAEITLKYYNHEGLIVRSEFVPPCPPPSSHSGFRWWLKKRYLDFISIWPWLTKHSAVAYGPKGSRPIQLPKSGQSKR